MRYAIDTARIPLDEYAAILKAQTLLPSRRILLDGLDGGFARIGAQGVTTVAQLLKALSSPAKVKAFAAQSGVDANYLSVLRREASTLQPKTVQLSDFPDTDPAEIAALAAQGIKTSKDCFERCAPGGRLHALSGLTRVNGVGPNAAAMFYAAGCRSAADIAGADAAEMLARVTAANADGRYYAGKLGEKDMRFCIAFAGLLNRFES